MGCTLLKPIVLSIAWSIGIINFLAFMSLVLYGLLYVVVEIFLQPRVATERQKGLLDNSLGTKLLIENTEGYYDIIILINQHMKQQAPSVIPDKPNADSVILRCLVKQIVNLTEISRNRHSGSCP